LALSLETKLWDQSWQTIESISAQANSGGNNDSTILLLTTSVITLHSQLRSVKTSPFLHHHAHHHHHHLKSSSSPSQNDKNNSVNINKNKK
jgi:hypothetical protein